MRHRVYAVLFVVATAIPVVDASTTTVYPTGLYPLDVENVQAALDQGGTVLLKATSAAGVPTSFNFGPPQSGSGFVEFHVDAELIGEDGQTVISGGHYPVRAFGQATTLAVRNITFVGAFDGALILFDANTEVTGNRVRHVLGRRVGSGRTIAEAVVVGFSASALIEDNVVSDIVADRGFGISQFRSTGPVVIRRNTISDTGYGAIESSFNVSDATGVPASVSITDNLLRPGPAPTAFGMGIEVNGEGAYYVAGNDILIESPFGLGVYALGAPEFGIAPMISPVIEKNRVMLQPVLDGRPVFADGIDLVGTVSRAYVGQNAVIGSGFAALGLYNVVEESELAFNTFVGNRIASFQPLEADVYLDTATHDTVLKGNSGTVLDFGSNNRITGFTRGQNATGAQLSAATRLRNERKQESAALQRRR